MYQIDICLLQVLQPRQRARTGELSFSQLQPVQLQSWSQLHTISNSHLAQLST